MIKFGANLKEERKKQGYSQKSFGKILGTAQTTIANYENGNRFPTGEMLMMIAKTLNVSIDRLMGHQIEYYDASFEILNQEVCYKNLSNLILQNKLQDAFDYVMLLHPTKDRFLSIHEHVFMKVLKELNDRYVKDDISYQEQIRGSNDLFDIIVKLSVELKCESQLKHIMLTINQMS